MHRKSASDSATFRNSLPIKCINLQRASHWKETLGLAFKVVHCSVKFGLGRAMPPKSSEWRKMELFYPIQCLTKAMNEINGESDCQLELCAQRTPLPEMWCVRAPAGFLHRSDISLPRRRQREKSLPFIYYICLFIENTDCALFNFPVFFLQKYIVETFSHLNTHFVSFLLSLVPFSLFLDFLSFHVLLTTVKFAVGQYWHVSHREQQPHTHRPLASVYI